MARHRVAGVTSEFVLDGTPGRLVTAAGPDGRPTHVQLSIGKHGSTLAGLTDALSTAITTGLQSGVPPIEFIGQLRHTRYAPAGATGDPVRPRGRKLRRLGMGVAPEHGETGRKRGGQAVQGSFSLAGRGEGRLPDDAAVGVAAHSADQQVSALGEVIGVLIAVPDEFGTQAQQQGGFDLSGVHVVAAAADQPGLLTGGLPVLPARVEGQTALADIGFLHDDST
jgi:hypothetical protein